MTTQTLQDIPIQKIHLGRNPRTRFDQEKLQELARSIQERGQKQAVIVEPYKDGYLLVVGERRLRAVKLLQQTHIQAYVRPTTNHNGQDRFIDALIENDQREEMTPMDTARAYRVLRDEYGMSVRKISKLIGKRESLIDNLLVLTDLDPEIQDMIDQGLWKDPRLARGLLSIEDRGTRIALAAKLLKHKVSLKACLKAVGDANRLAGAMQRSKKITKGSPARILAEAEEKPSSWDMLRQLGRVPAWELVVLSAERTCETCPLRSMASRVTCEECGAVSLLRSMVEASHAK
jgi:ParB/RepB/Spo0J family partition protein